MAKLTLSDLASLANSNTAVTTLNNNSALIETAVENTLSRDGSAPNQMGASLDMNSNSIFNLPDPSSGTEPVRLQDIEDLVLTSGTGNVVGPVSATSGNVAVFSGSSGKTITDSGSNIFGFFANNPPIVANLPSLYEGAVLGTPGTGKVHHINRLFVGEAALTTGDLLVGPPLLPTIPSWIDVLMISPIVGGSQFSSVATCGDLAITGVSRTSDFRDSHGFSSGGSQGVTGIAYNDETVGGSIACAVASIAIHAEDCLGISLSQFDICNNGPPVIITPSTGMISRSAVCLLLTSGAYPAIASTNPTAALIIGTGGVAPFQKGIIFGSDSLNTSIGDGGSGVAMELFEGQGIRWLNDSDVVESEIYANDFGFIINSDIGGASAVIHQIGGVNKLFTTSSALQPAAHNGLTLGADAVRWSTVYTGTLVASPGASVTPANNGDVTFQLTNNTTLTFKAKGSDGTVRSGAVTLS